MNIISDALKYYDGNNEKYTSIKRRIKYMKHADIDQKDVEGVKITFYDENKKELFTSRIEILGKYFNNINTWVWGWSLPTYNKSMSSIIRKVFLYGTDIDINNNADIILRNELITSRFRVADDVQLDIHCAVASYLAKKPFIFIWKEFLLKFGEMNEVKGPYFKGKTDVTYYTFIVDPPDDSLL